MAACRRGENRRLARRGACHRGGLVPVRAAAAVRRPAGLATPEHARGGAAHVHPKKIQKKKMGLGIPVTVLWWKLIKTD